MTYEYDGKGRDQPGRGRCPDDVAFAGLSCRIRDRAKRLESAVVILSKQALAETDTTAVDRKPHERRTESAGGPRAGHRVARGQPAECHGWTIPSPKACRSVSRQHRGGSSSPAWASPVISAAKIAATLASTGTPSFFVHPGEASHGDLGMITGQDTYWPFPISGETDEVVTILPLIKRIGARLISMTGKPVVDARAGGRRASQCQRGRRSLSVESRTDRQHDRDAGDGRCAGRCACWKAADSRLRISLCLIRAAAWASACCCGSGDIMHTGDEVPAVREDVTLQ